MQLHARCALSLLAFGTALGTVPLSAQRGLSEDLPSAITIGTNAVMWSSILQQERRLQIYLPSTYRDAPAARYPVLVLLDGEWNFHHVTGIVAFLSKNRRIPEMIVVGVPNVDRFLDLTPAPADTGIHGRNTGGAEPFRRFLVDELMPWLKTNYRAADFRVLVGHSLGGLFAIDAIVSDPTSFNDYIAVSPSLWWAGRALAHAAPDRLERITGERMLYFTTGDGEPSIKEPSEELAKALEQRKLPGVKWKFRYLPGESHGTTPHRTVYDGLEWAFAGWREDAAKIAGDSALIAAGDLHALEARYAALSEKHGFPTWVSEGMVERLVQVIRSKPQGDERALTVLRDYIDRYPVSAASYETIGEVYEELGKLPEAAAAFRRALDLAYLEDDGFTSGRGGHHDNLDRVLKKLAEAHRP
jgi:predicted alpha/beta superfamily hydrolase